MSETFKDIKGYKIDLVANKIIINDKFYKASLVFGNMEYSLLKAIREDYPELEIVVKKTRSVRNKYRCMTYEGIELFIKNSNYENKQKLLENYESVKKDTYNKKQVYKNVRKWFITQFPDYEKLDINHYITPIENTAYANN